MRDAAPLSPAGLPADVRAVIVRQLAAALADAWRRQHAAIEQDAARGDTERVEPEVGRQ